jgi:hypothetical protein
VPVILFYAAAWRNSFKPTSKRWGSFKTPRRTRNGEQML